ncbi:hypothetical protein PENSPDRAFT_752910 [Peniophora sp. CONT]|nr:hypothetical protein PENSPDRAFT_752910 [Peniophora sp. CONT]
MSSQDRRLGQLEAALHDAQSALPGVILGSLLLGVFTLLIAFSAYILKHKGLRKRPYAVMLFAVVHMYTCALIFWAVTVYSLLQAVMDPDRYAILDAKSAGARSRVLLVCLGLNFWFSDFIVVWRIWALWADSRKMWCIRAVSCTLVLGVVVAGLADFIQDLMVTVDRSYPTAGQAGSYFNEPSPLYASFAGVVAAFFSAVLNVWCVALAFVKLWQIKRLQAIIGHRLRDSRPGKLLIILCFSGLAYCIFWVYWVVASAVNGGPGLNQTLLLCNSAAAVQINGIYPTFVITSLSLQQANNADEQVLPTILSSVVDPLVRSPSTTQNPSRQSSLRSTLTFATRNS